MSRPTTSAALTDDGEDQPPRLSATLRTMAAELQRLAEISDGLQPLVSAALVADGATNHDHVREFQAMDFLVQHLHGVSAFAAALADGAPDGWRLDAADAATCVSLTDLAKRLAGQAAADPKDEVEDDFELF
jgi:hypothetical protein